MRISDWSADVCSSDLGRLDQRRALARLDHEGVARLAQPFAGDVAYLFGRGRLDVAQHVLVAVRLAGVGLAGGEHVGLAADAADALDAADEAGAETEIGRESRWERVCQCVENSGGA